MSTVPARRMHINNNAPVRPWAAGAKKNRRPEPAVLRRSRPKAAAGDQNLRLNSADRRIERGAL
jgi:hypothetical protein